MGKMKDERGKREEGVGSREECEWMRGKGRGKREEKRREEKREEAVEGE